ncbi:hypothetical protein P186_1876 [Pyrobaculum ferrireducens]|uniref:Peroxiredoxin n=1 Tax=Pyrobaculum ferrireducens TaxID=1104324 RepID=G7VHI7_9CREN|nr:hypothetical protein P186_1876 [Pyrobaculum ferrireducens]
MFASGAVNRICCLVVYSAAALASGYRVTVHLVNEGLVAFKKDVLPKLNTGDLETAIHPPMYTPYVETYIKNLKDAVAKGALKTWYDFLKDLKSQYGDRLKIYACPLASQLYGISKDQLVDVVDDVRGAEYFLEEVYGGVVMYL